MKQASLQLGRPRTAPTSRAGTPPIPSTSTTGLHIHPPSSSTYSFYPAASSQAHGHGYSHSHGRSSVSRARMRICLGAGVAAVLLLWLVTPTPSTLYDPREHTSVQDNYDPGTEEIVNSIVIPSYNEGDNMHPLVSRIFQSLPVAQVRQTEVLIIDDDSHDSTSEQVERLREGGYNVHLHVRKTERGLSSAVLYGFSRARGARLVVMDADLQHPPENIPDLLHALPDAPQGSTVLPPQFALGTRYAPGVEIDRDWPAYRRIISWGARVLARPLTSAQDPMGGFFALRRSLFLEAQPLNPSGFKIGLELLLKTPLSSEGLAHVPYAFSKRVSGSSKLGAKVILKYVGQLLALYRWKFGLLFYAFVGCAVGLGVWTALTALEWVVEKGGWEGRRWTGLLAVGEKRKKRRKARNDV